MPSSQAASHGLSKYLISGHYSGQKGAEGGEASTYPDRLVSSGPPPEPTTTISKEGMTDESRVFLVKGESTRSLNSCFAVGQPVLQVSLSFPRREQS